MLIKSTSLTLGWAQGQTLRKARSNQLRALCLAIGSGHNLKIMTARIFKVSATSSAIGIDLVRPMVMRVCPERKPAPPDAPENFVKLHLAHQKGVMLRRNIAVGVVEVQSDLIIHLDSQERSEWSWNRKSEDFNKKSCGRALIARVDDGMVKFNAHSRNPSYENSFSLLDFSKAKSAKTVPGGGE